MRLSLFSPLIFCIIAAITTSSFCHARNASFSWTANSDEIDGYRLYILAGTRGRISKTNYTEVKELKKITSYTCRGLEDQQTYRFALTAFRRRDNQESVFSKVVTLYPFFVLQMIYDLLLLEETR